MPQLAIRHIAILFQRGREQHAGAASQSRAGMGRCADMIKTGHVGAVIHRRLEWTPDEKLIDAAEATIGVATDEVHIHRFKVGWRIGLAGDDRFGKAVYVLGEDTLDTVGILFAQFVSPAPIAGRGEFSCGIAFDVSRGFGQLQPEDRLTFRCAGGSSAVG